MIPHTPEPKKCKKCGAENPKDEGYTRQCLCDCHSPSSGMSICNDCLEHIHEECSLGKCQCDCRIPSDRKIAESGMEWGKKFDKEYGTKDPKIWAIGIVAEALGHEKINGFGADASHITKKLLKLNSQGISEARAEERREIISKIEEIGEMNSDWTEFAKESIAPDKDEKTCEDIIKTIPLIFPNDLIA